MKKLGEKELLAWFNELTGYTGEFVKDCGFSGVNDKYEMACCQILELIKGGLNEHPKKN